MTNVEGLEDEAAIQRRVEELQAINYSIHYHNWTQKEMFDLVSQLDERFNLPMEIQLFVKHEGDIVFIIKKQSVCSSQ